MSDPLDSARRSPDRFLEAATYGFEPNAAPLTPPSEPRRELDAASTRRFADAYRRLVAEIEKAFVGQRELVVGALVALFSGGHVLVESVPGLGKTLFAQALGRALGCRFGRVQFTPDLTPSDVVGALVFNAKEQEFTFRPGPILRKSFSPTRSTAPPPRRTPRFSKRRKKAPRRSTVKRIPFRARSLRSRRKTRSSPKARTAFRKRSSTALCSSSSPITRAPRRKPEF